MMLKFLFCVGVGILVWCWDFWFGVWDRHWFAATWEIGVIWDDETDISLGMENSTISCFTQENSPILVDDVMFWFITTIFGMVTSDENWYFHFVVIRHDSI